MKKGAHNYTNFPDSQATTYQLNQSISQLKFIKNLCNFSTEIAKKVYKNLSLYRST